MLLQACQQAPPEGLFHTFIAPNQQHIRAEERLRAFQERAEYVTSHGLHNKLHPDVVAKRYNYYNDYQFLLDSLARVGLELRKFPGTHWKSAFMHIRHCMRFFPFLFSFLFLFLLYSGSLS
jgi:hypothetical protein